MSNIDRHPILLTPGPLTTTLTTKAAMLRDRGSWDASFNAVTARVRERLTAIINGSETHVCVAAGGGAAGSTITIPVRPETVEGRMVRSNHV